MSAAPPNDMPRGAFWLFAYGSLMWQPDFPFTTKRVARLYGYHRALCIQSWTYRGSPSTPGVVFGLDRGGAVNGIVYRIGAADAAAVYAQVMAREMVSNVYRPVWASCQLPSSVSSSVPALAFVADRQNPQYAGRLGDDAALKLISQGHGKGGSCVDYVLNTQRHLAELGIQDRSLARIVRLLGA